MFLGPSSLSLDAKGRLSIPAKYQAALISEAGGQLWVTKHPHGCLMILPKPEWDVFYAIVAGLPMSDLWLKITKDSPILLGKSFDVSRIFEVVKYFTKVADMNDEQLAEIVKWSHGKRFLSRLGALHDNDELAELMDAQDTGEPECCPECGCNEYVDVPVVFDPRLCRYVREQDWYDRPLILPLSPS